MFPAWDQRLDAADSLNGNLVLIDCGADASKPLDIGFRKEALISPSFCNEDKSSPFVEADGFNRNVQSFCNFSYWEGRRIFILFFHTCIYKYKYDAICMVHSWQDFTTKQGGDSQRCEIHDALFFNFEKHLSYFIHVELYYTRGCRTPYPKNCDMLKYLVR